MGSVVISSGHAKDVRGAADILDEVENYVALGMSQEPGEALVRVDAVNQPHAYFLDVPLDSGLKVSPAGEHAFRDAVAKRWYKPWRKNE